eukprot:COSAG05_NODE_5931_length_1056_cov_1.455590_1_plen_98_part_10
MPEKEVAGDLDTIQAKEQSGTSMNAMGYDDMGRTSLYFLGKYLDAGFHTLKLGVRPGHGLLSDVVFDTKGGPAKCILQYSSDIAEVKYQFKSKDKLDV